MDRSRICKLISEVFTENQYGVQVPAETEREVFCNVRSISQNEWFEGARNGLNPEFQVIVFQYDYAGEQIIELNGKRYTIYRTYVRDDEMIELYIERKQGNA